MKKVLSILVLAFGISVVAQAQINQQALGVRLGGGNVGNLEFSYQKALGGENRFEADLGFGGNSTHNRLYVAGIYQWVWSIDGGFNWYAGPGGTVGFWSFKDKTVNNYVNVGIGGQIGIEFDFNTMGTPLLMSIDARPMWDLLGDDAGLGWGAALGIRYTF
jgi:hypothetical protein